MTLDVNNTLITKASRGVRRIRHFHSEEGFSPPCQRYYSRLTLYPLRITFFARLGTDYEVRNQWRLAIWRQ